MITCLWVGFILLTLQFCRARGRVGEAQFDNCIARQIEELLPEVKALPAQKVREAARLLLQERGREAVILLWYGRRHYVEILFPYLLRALRSNGGIVSKIVIVLNTEYKPDVTYARSLARLQGVELYSAPNWFDTLFKFNHVWKNHLALTNTILVRVDDDIVFIEDGAIERLVLGKLQRTDAIIVSGNIINSLQIPEVHQRRGLWGRNMSECAPPIVAGYSFPNDTLLAEVCEVTRKLTQFHYFGDSYKVLEFAVRQHWDFIRSMFQHERFTYTTERYYIPDFDLRRCRCVAPQRGFPIVVKASRREWRKLPNCNNGTYRWSINFFAIDTEEFRGWTPFSHEEPFFSAFVPEASGKPSILIGSALAAHALYSPQRRVLRKVSWNESQLYLRYYNLLSEAYTGVALKKNMS